MTGMRLHTPELGRAEASPLPLECHGSPAGVDLSDSPDGGRLNYPNVNSGRIHLDHSI